MPRVASAKPFGWTGVPVPVVGQGTWHMGESLRARAREVDALRLGLDLGLTHIDTAEMYGRGGAEEVIAEALRGRRRAEIFLVSKVLPQNASCAGTVRAAEQSLRRLGTDYLDLYLLHWPGRHPIAETMAAMEELVAAGKVALHRREQLRRAEMREAIAAFGRERLACNQVLYNLSRRGIERDLIPLLRRAGHGGGGLHAVRRLAASRSAGFDALEEIGPATARRRGRWRCAFSAARRTSSPSPRRVDPEHVRENAGAASFELDASDMAILERAFPAPRRRVPLAFG